MSLIVLCLFSCSTQELTQRESLEWVEIAHNGDLLSIRWVQSNTGLLKNQAHIRLNYFKPEQNAIEYLFHAPESEQIWSEEKLQVGSHSLLSEADQWKMNIHDDDFNLRIETDPQLASRCQFQSEAWSVEVLSLHSRDQGWLQSQKRSISLQGESLLIKHKGHKKDESPHRWLLVQSSSLQIFYEDWGDFQYGCMKKDGQLITLSAENIFWMEHGVQLKTKDATFNILWRKNLGIEDPYQHLLWLERIAADSVYPLDPIHWIQGYAQEEASSHFYPVIFRYQGNSPPEIKQRKTKPTFPNSKKSDNFPSSTTQDD